MAFGLAITIHGCIKAPKDRVTRTETQPATTSQGSDDAGNPADQEVSKKDKSSEREPSGEVVVVTDGIKARRTFFQTRNPIELELSESVIAPGDTFSLKNDTTDSVLIEDEVLGLAPAYEVTLKLFPSDDDYQGKFGYGENKLTLFVDDGAEGKRAEYKIIRRDFRFFGLGSGSFSQNAARLNGLEVSESEFVKAQTSNGLHIMTMGSLEMISR